MTLRLPGTIKVRVVGWAYDKAWAVWTGRFAASHACDAAGNFADAVKSAALQQARGDGRPVAARAIDQQGTILRQLFQIFRQMIERDAQTSGDVLLFALARRANVDGQRRLRAMTEVRRRTAR